MVVIFLMWTLRTLYIISIVFLCYFLSQVDKLDVGMQTKAATVRRASRCWKIKSFTHTVRMSFTIVCIATTISITSNTTMGILCLARVQTLKNILLRVNWLKGLYMERGSSAVECRTHNWERPSSNPPFDTVSKLRHFCSLPFTQLYKWIHGYR